MKPSWEDMLCIFVLTLSTVKTPFMKSANGFRSLGDTSGRLNAPCLIEPLGCGFLIPVGVLVEGRGGRLVAVAVLVDVLVAVAVGVVVPPVAFSLFVLT